MIKELNERGICPGCNRKLPEKIGTNSALHWNSRIQRNGVWYCDTCAARYDKFASSLFQAMIGMNCKKCNKNVHKVGTMYVIEGHFVCAECAGMQPATEAKPEKAAKPAADKMQPIAATHPAPVTAKPGTAKTQGEAVTQPASVAAKPQNDKMQFVPASKTAPGVAAKPASASQPASATAKPASASQPASATAKPADVTSLKFTCRVECGIAIAEVSVSVEAGIFANVDCCLLDYGTGNRMGVVARENYACFAERESDISKSFKNLAYSIYKLSPEKSLYSDDTYRALMASYQYALQKAQEEAEAQRHENAQPANPIEGKTRSDYDFRGIEEAAAYSKIESIRPGGNSKYSDDYKYLHTLFSTDLKKKGYGVSESVVMDERNNTPYYIVTQYDGQMCANTWYLERVELTFSQVEALAKLTSAETYERFRGISRVNWTQYTEKIKASKSTAATSSAANAPLPKRDKSGFRCMVTEGSDTFVSINVQLGGRMHADVVCDYSDYGTGNRVGHVQERFSCQSKDGLQPGKALHDLARKIADKIPYHLISEEQVYAALETEYRK